MKKILALMFVLSILLTLCSCEKPMASDYVRGTKAKVDNDIPFVYTKGLHSPNGHELIFGYYEKSVPYKELAKIYGNKVIHESEYEGKKYYYTVYFEDDNSLYYVFLTKTESGDFILKSGDVDWISATVSEYDVFGDNVLPLDESIPPYILEQDRVEILLDGKLPFRRDPHYITGTNSFLSGMLSWSQYEQILALYSIDRGIDRVKDNVTEFYRILHRVAFDYTNEKGHEKCGALYLYEITVFKDGTGTLRFAHIDENAPFEDIPPNQDETVSLTKEETDSFLKVIEERNFYSLPSYNPEDSMGLDGYTTYVFGDNGEKTHLIKHWVASERYDIYHIRKAVEELTKSKIDVKYGGVYIDYGYNY